MTTQTTTTINNTTTFSTSTTPSSRISQVQGEERRTQDLTLPNNNNNNNNNTSIFNHNITNVDTSKSVQPTNDKDRLETVLQLADTVIQTYRKSIPDNSGAADLLFLQGKTYRYQGDKLINHLSSLLCFEKALKIYLGRALIGSCNYIKLSEIYTELGHVYKDLKDINKAFACFKKAYWLNSEHFSRTGSFRDSIPLLSSIKSLLKIENLDSVGISLHPSIILPHGEIDLNYINLALLKQKIQTALLDPIANAVEKGYGWSYPSYTGDWGVKGYINRDYVKKILTGLGEKEENIEPAQMLCFEAMNLAKLKAMTKSDETVAEFTKAYPSLINRIENEHPEFFVDGSIVTICQYTISNYISNHRLFKDIDYFLKL